MSTDTKIITSQPTSQPTSNIQFTNQPLMWGCIPTEYADDNPRSCRNWLNCIMSSCFCPLCPIFCVVNMCCYSETPIKYSCCPLRDHDTIICCLYKKRSTNYLFI